MIHWRDFARSRVGKTVAIFLAVLALTACEAIGEEARSSAAARPAISDGLADRPFNLATDCIPAGQVSNGQCALPPDVPTPGSTYYRISSLTNPVEQAVWRNRFQDYLLWRSDKLCQRYKAGLTATQSGVNFTLDTITTGVAAVAAVVVAPATNILGAIGAISSGTRGHFNEDFYQRFIAPAIIKQIDLSRSGRIKVIMAKRGVNVENRQAVEITASGSLATPLKDQKIVLMETYTLEESIADVERYHQMCSAAAALGEIVKDPPKFKDTATGIKDRLGLLREQQKANAAQMEELKKKNPNLANETAISRLAEANADLSKQIIVLQQQLLTAPATTD
jgi:hypothetical protein